MGLAPIARKADEDDFISLLRQCRAFAERARGVGDGEKQCRADEDARAMGVAHDMPRIGTGDTRPRTSKRRTTRTTLTAISAIVARRCAISIAYYYSHAAYICGFRRAHATHALMRSIISISSLRLFSSAYRAVSAAGHLPLSLLSRRQLIAL